MHHIESGCLLLGRFLLGLYFIVPGFSKIFGWEGTVAYMAQQNVPFIEPLLVITIIVQLGAGAALIIGFQGQIAAFLLAGLTFMINIFMHNFWNFPEADQPHEMQNFIKNLAIMAGLLVIAAMGTGRFSLTKTAPWH